MRERRARQRHDLGALLGEVPRRRADEVLHHRAEAAFAPAHQVERPAAHASRRRRRPAATTGIRRRRRRARSRARGAPPGSSASIERAEREPHLGQALVADPHLGDRAQLLPDAPRLVGEPRHPERHLLAPGAVERGAHGVPPLAGELEARAGRRWCRRRRRGCASRPARRPASPRSALKKHGTSPARSAASMNSRTDSARDCRGPERVGEDDARRRRGAGRRRCRRVVRA